MAPNVQINTSSEWLGQGGQLNINSMRPHLGVHQNALLRRDEWEELDTAVVDVTRTTLNGIADLVSRGLVRNLGGLGAIISTYEQLSDMNDADVSMEGIVEGEDDRVGFTPQSLPVPIIHKDFSLSMRHLEASRRQGESLDTTQARVATRKVRDVAEGMLFNGHAKQIAGFKIYGYTSHPKRINKTATQFGGGDFGTAGNGYKTIVGMINELAAKGFPAPYGCYISRTQYGELLKPVGTAYERNEYEAITSGVPGLDFVKPGDMLADGSLVVVSLNSDVVDIAIAQDVTAIQWEERGGMLARFRVMTALVPRIKFDAKDQCGVAHATSA